jgi:hypothetical protein
MRQWMSILGPAANSTQQLNFRQAELNKLVEDAGGRYAGLAGKALEYYRVQQSGADLAIKVQNGAATAVELYQQKVAELNILVGQQKLTQDQANESLRVYAQKTLPDVIRQQEVFKSSTPALTGLAQDAANLQKSLDQELAGALRGSTQDLIAMAEGTVTLGEGLKNLSRRLLEAIANALLMKTVVGPIAGLLSGGLPSISGFLSGGASGGSAVTASAFGNVFERGRMLAFANGGIIDRPRVFPMAMGMGLAGEAGPEAIMPLGRDERGRLGVRGGGSGVPIIVINNYSGEKISQKQTTTTKGSPYIEMTIGQMITDHVRNDLAKGDGDIDRAMRTRYGLKPQLA